MIIINLSLLGMYLLDGLLLTFFCCFECFWYLALYLKIAHWKYLGVIQ